MADLGEPRAGGWEAGWIRGSESAGLCLLVFLCHFFWAHSKKKEHFISITTELLNEDKINTFFFCN